MSRISSTGFDVAAGGLLGTMFPRVKDLYFCLASTYLYKKSLSTQATARAGMTVSGVSWDGMGEKGGERDLQWRLRRCLVRRRRRDGLMDDKLQSLSAISSL